jgi:PAS domain S-box-containing protein
MNQHIYNVILYLSPIVASLLVTFGLSLLAFRRRRVTGGLPFAILLLLETEWIGGYILSLLNPTLEAKIFWENFQYIGTLFGPLMMLVFAYEYCEKKPKYGWKFWAGLSIPGFIVIILSITNPWHQLAVLNQRLIPGEPFDYYGYDFGIPVYVVLIYSYFLMGWANYLLLKQYSLQNGIYRRQTGFILAGLMIPTISSLTIFLDLSFLPQRDISPYYFAVANLFIAYGLFRLRVFDIIPIGRSLVVSNMRDGLLIVDSSGHLVDINQAACNLIGQSNLIANGQPVGSLPGNWGSYLQMDPDSHISDIKEFSISNPLGVQYYEMTVTRIINDRNQFAGQMMMVRNVTQRKNAELDLYAALSEMESFSYSISHDLRAPLRSISGYANALHEEMNGTLPDEHVKYLQRIMANAQRMDELINALLSFSRLSRKPLECKLIHPGELVREAWEEVREEAGGRKISIQIDDLPDCLADRILLKQVYVNLLSNAIKYTRLQPEAAIRVGWTNQDGEIVNWVNDNGVGFDMQYADKLFGIFQRLHSNDQFEGNGIGLSIVKRIISRHKGRIWAEGYPNQGATFYFVLSKEAA